MKGLSDILEAARKNTNDAFSATGVDSNVRDLIGALRGKVANKPETKPTKVIEVPKAKTPPYGVWLTNWEDVGGLDPHPDGFVKAAWEVEITLKDPKGSARAVFESPARERNFEVTKTWEGGGVASIVDDGVIPDFLQDLIYDQRIKSYRYKLVTTW